MARRRCRRSGSVAGGRPTRRRRRSPSWPARRRERAPRAASRWANPRSAPGCRSHRPERSRHPGRRPLPARRRLRPWRPRRRCLYRCLRLHRRLHRRPRWRRGAGTRRRCTRRPGRECPRSCGSRRTRRSLARRSPRGRRPGRGTPSAQRRRRRRPGRCRAWYTGRRAKPRGGVPLITRSRQKSEATWGSGRSGKRPLTLFDAPRPEAPEPLHRRPSRTLEVRKSPRRRALGYLQVPPGTINKEMLDRMARNASILRGFWHTSARICSRRRAEGYLLVRSVSVHLGLCQPRGTPPWHRSR